MSERRPLNELKAELYRRRITQTELARRMQIGRSYLSQMLNGLEPLKRPYARLISHCTGIPLSIISPDEPEVKT